MTDNGIAKLRKLLASHAEKGAAAPPASKTGQGTAERQRRACADCLRNTVRPALDAFSTELKNAGHEAATRDNTDRADAYPSVALSFTPRGGLASALLFKCDPKRGILVQRDVKASPAKGRTITASTDRLGVIGTEAVSTQWVEQKILTFVEDVLKAN
ncbi:MAG TPA: hypothetical protein VLV16_05425 [Gemmatimonadales bacterium]|nr:hypothetical protein [Gemmatimonadales bacterium]